MWGVGLVTAALVGGCAFSLAPPPGAVQDAAVDAPPDAPPDAAPMWIVVETIVVDTANPAPVHSVMTLDAGVHYRLRVAGVIDTVIDAFQGDADYFDFANPRDNGCCEDLGLGINDLVVNDLDTKPDWGPYNPTHVYEATWIGMGSTITALYQDTYYDNNQGNLTLEILAFR